MYAHGTGQHRRYTRNGKSQLERKNNSLLHKLMIPIYVKDNEH